MNFASIYVLMRCISIIEIYQRYLLMNEYCITFNVMWNVVLLIKMGKQSPLCYITINICTLGLSTIVLSPLFYFHLSFMWGIQASFITIMTMWTNSLNIKQAFLFLPEIIQIVITHFTTIDSVLSITDVDPSLAIFCGIRLGDISQQLSKLLFCIMSLEMTLLKSLRHLSWTKFLHDRPWILPWIKSIFNELDITIHVIASQLSGHCDVVSNRLGRHQQNENRASETRWRCVKLIVIYPFVMSCKK